MPIPLQPTLDLFNCLRETSSPSPSPPGTPLRRRPAPDGPESSPAVGQDVTGFHTHCCPPSALSASLTVCHLLLLSMSSCPNHFIFWLWILVTLCKSDQKRRGRKEQCSDVKRLQPSRAASLNILKGVQSKAALKPAVMKPLVAVVPEGF